MRSLLATAFHSHKDSPASRRQLVQLLGIAPVALLLTGLLTVLPAPLAAPVAAAAPVTAAITPGTVVAWGDNEYGETDVPAGLSGVIAVSAGEWHSLALKSDGTVVSWGGQTAVPVGLSGVTAISAGYNHSLALKSDGTVVAWGNNVYGQATVPADLSGVTAISAGQGFNLALKSDGTVVAWGWDYRGETNVPAGLSGVTAISAGQDFSLALKSDGTVVGWGENWWGQTTPPSNLSGVIAISAGLDQSLALKSDGTVVAWGDDDYGQTDVWPGLSGVSAISAGGKFSLALVGGLVGGWGCEALNMLNPPAGLSGVTAIDAGGWHSLALVAPPATHLTVSSLSSPRTAGTPGSITVSAKEASGNTAAGYRGKVHFTSTDPKAALPADYKFTAADAGTHVFSVTLKTAGTQSVTATDTLTKTIKGSQAGIVVKAAAVKTLVVSGLTTPRTAGSTGNIRVSAVDAYGNRVSSYRGTVHFTSSDAKAKLPANYKFTATDNGTHAFVASVILKTAGTQSVTATDTLTKTIKGSQAGIVVKAAAVKTLVVSGLTTPRTKGVAGTIRVTAVDAYGNRVSSYRGTIHFTSSDAKAGLPANYTFKATDAGTHVFTVTLKTAGTQWVRARDKVTSTITGAQTGIVVH